MGRESILIENLMKQVRDKVCSVPDNLERYFTNNIYRVVDLGSNESYILPQNFNIGDYSLSCVPNGLVEVDPSGDMGGGESETIYDEVGSTLGYAMIDSMYK